MQLTLILFPIALAIYGVIIYLFVLLVKALRKYIKSKDVREEKKAVCRPSTSNLCALAKLYGIPVEELLHETQEEKSED